MKCAAAYFSVVGCLAKITGHVDGIGRPLISVISIASGDPFVATVDTGFNGTLLTSAEDAPALGVRFLGQVERVELGDGRMVNLRLGLLTVDWLGSHREVDVFVSDAPSRGGEGRPVALVGAQLLAPHLLLVDYRAGTVEIETQDAR